MLAPDPSLLVVHTWAGHYDQMLDLLATCERQLERDPDCPDSLCLKARAEAQLASAATALRRAMTEGGAR